MSQHQIRRRAVVYSTPPIQRTYMMTEGENWCGFDCRWYKMKQERRRAIGGARERATARATARSTERGHTGAEAQYCAQQIQQNDRG